MRANTLNLLAVARNERGRRPDHRDISRLHDFLPSRTIILVTRPQGEDSASVYDVNLQLNEQHSSKDEPTLHFETITISAGMEEFGHLSSLVSPLLAAELPDFLWWPAG